MKKLLRDLIFVFLFFVVSAYAEPFCKVEETENSVTTYERDEEHGVGLTTTTIITWGDLLVDYLMIIEMEDVGTIGIDIMKDICKEAKENMDPGENVRCAPNKVISSNSMFRADVPSKHVVKKNAEKECEEFYRNLKNTPKKTKKTTKYPVTACNVKVEEGAVLMDVVGNGFKVNSKSSPGYHNTAHTIEIYTGFSKNDLSYICGQYKKDPDISNVHCDGNKIVMDESYDELGDASLENIYSVNKLACRMLQSGEAVLENAWEND